MGAETGVIVVFDVDFGEFVVRVSCAWLCVELSSGDRRGAEAIVSYGIHDWGLIMSAE